MKRRKSAGRGRRWRIACAAAAGIALLLAAGGVAEQTPGWMQLRPTFNDPSQHIRYHAGFHDGHSHDGYGHGYHDGDAQHTHNTAGQPVPQERNAVWRYGAYPSVYAGADHVHGGPAPLGMDHTFYTFGMGKAGYDASDPTPYSVLDGVAGYAMVGVETGETEGPSE
ncbi:MAG: hypothetical protein HY681_00215 [Chloroflexi bacterium]|nr:hypothetical protein [Chloroflexota bacterium]